MATTIITKNGSGAPTDGDLNVGELAVDLTNKQLYTKNSDGVIKLGGSGNSGEWEVNGDDIYYDDGNVGIGGSSPTRRLYVESDQQAVAQFVSTTDVKAALQIGCANSTNNNNQWIGTEGKDLRFATGNQTRLTIDASGNVGIGTDAPNKRLEVARLGNAETITGLDGNTAMVVSKGGGTDTSGACAAFVGGENAEVTGITMGGLADPRQSRVLHSNVDDSLNFHTGNEAVPRMTINSDGNVGIGADPLRSTAKEQLAEWKASFDARLKAEPKADKKAVTLEITDDAFEVLPTEEALAEWMETRAAGDKLQVNGNITAITGPGSFGTVSGNRFVSANQAGFVGRTGANNGLPYILPVDGDGNISDDAVSLGRTTTEGSGNNHRFRDAHFSGTVNAGGISATGTVNAVGGVNVGADPGVTGIRLYASGAIYARMASTSTNQLFRGYGGTDLTSWINSKGDANFSGTVEANQFTRNGVPVPTTVDLIKTLTTLRNATKDETTLEGLRDAIGNAIGGLIEEFEAMQDQVSTQDIQE